MEPVRNTICAVNTVKIMIMEEQMPVLTPYFLSFDTKLKRFNCYRISKLYLFLKRGLPIPFFRVYHFNEKK